MAGRGHGAGEFVRERRIVGAPLAEAAYLRRRDHEAAFGQRAAEVLGVAVRVPALGAVLPQPDDVADAVAVSVQAQHARRRTGEFFRRQHVERASSHRAKCAARPSRGRRSRGRPSAPASPPPGRRPLQEAQVAGEHAAGARAASAVGAVKAQSRSAPACSASSSRSGSNSGRWFMPLLWDACGPLASGRPVPTTVLCESVASLAAAKMRSTA